MPLRHPPEKGAVFVCQSNWHLTCFVFFSVYPPPPSFSFHSSRFLTHSSPYPLSICTTFVPISLHSTDFVSFFFHSFSLILSLNLRFFPPFFSWYLQTLQQQSLRLRWSPLWKRQPSLRPLLRPSHLHLQRGLGASETPDHPPSSKQSTLTHLIYCALYLPEEGHQKAINLLKSCTLHQYLKTQHITLVLLSWL